jgi:hypothetical protein
VNLALEYRIEQDSRFGRHVSGRRQVLQSEAILLLCSYPWAVMGP